MEERSYQLHWGVFCARLKELFENLPVRWDLSRLHLLVERKRICLPTIFHAFVDEEAEVIHRRANFQFIQLLESSLNPSPFQELAHLCVKWRTDDIIVAL